MKLLNKTAYNEMILAEEDTVYFHIFEEARTKSNKYRDAKQSWMKLSIKVEPIIGASNIRLCKKISKLKVDDITRNPNNVSTRLNYFGDTYENLMQKSKTHK